MRLLLRPKVTWLISARLKDTAESRRLQGGLLLNFEHTAGDRRSGGTSRVDRDNEPAVFGMDDRVSESAAV